MAVESLPGILKYLSALYFHLPLIVTSVLASPITELTALKSKTHFFLPLPEVTDVDAGA